MLRNIQSVWRTDKLGRRHPCLALDFHEEAIRQVDFDPLISHLRSSEQEQRFDSLVEVLKLNCLQIKSLALSLYTVECHVRYAISIHSGKYKIIIDGAKIIYPIYDDYCTRQVLNGLLNIWNKSIDEPRVRSVRFEIDRLIDRLKKVYPKNLMIESIEIARDKRVPFSRKCSSLPIYMFGSGKNRIEFFHQYSGKTGYIAAILANNKSASNEVFALNGLPAPRQWTVSTAGAARLAASRIGFPVVVKPQQTNYGIAVTPNIETTEKLDEAFRQASKYGLVLVEKHVRGFDHRILVIDGEAQRVYKRSPAHVVGDSRHSLRDLIRLKAQARLKEPDFRDFKFVEPDEPQVLDLLQQQSLGLDDVPEKGRCVWLRANGNVSTGGTTERVTEHAHPDNLRLAERAAELVGLDIAGVDFIIEDISVSWREVDCGICEINPTPGMQYAEDPDRLMRYLTGDYSDNLRVPIVMVVGNVEAIKQCLTQCVEREQGMGRPLTVVGCGMVFQRGTPILKSESAIGKCLNIALQDRQTEAVVIFCGKHEALEISFQTDYIDECILISEEAKDEHNQFAEGEFSDCCKEISVYRGAAADFDLGAHIAVAS